MSRAVFKEYSQGQICLFPMSLDEKISPDAPVRLVKEADSFTRQPLQDIWRM